MNSYLDDIFDKLKLNEKNGLIYKDSQINVSERIKYHLKFIDYDAIYVMDEIPLIIFKEYKDINEFNENFEEFHNNIWNLNDIPVIFVIIPNEIRIYNANIFEKDDARLDIFYESDFSDIININTLMDASFFEKYSESFSKSKKVQDYLLDNIKETIKLLKKELPLTVIQNLICKLIFSRYLLDRNVVDDEFFQRYFNSSFSELFSDTNKLFSFFNILEEKFFTDIFKISENDFNKINERHLRILKMLFDGQDMKNLNHKNLKTYNFKIIPVEIISNIYEIFLRDNTLKNNKSYYTPLFLVDYILNRSLDEKLKNKNDCKVLDPTCGSGVFLVESLRRMIKKYEKSGIELNSEVLTGIVTENIFGIDRDENAVNIAVLSVLLTVYDYLTAEEIRDFKLPVLLNKNFFVCDLFDLNREINDLPHFDLIVGNPPWGDKQDLALEYCKNNNIPISNKEIIQSVLIRVGDFADDMSEIALVCSSKVLYNHNAVAFRKYFLNRFNLEKVLELSAIRRKIFPNAIGPAAILFYNKKLNESNIVEHISLKPNKLFYLLSSVVIQSDDVKFISQKDLLEHDWVWKSLIYGNLIDFNLLKRLKNTKSINDYINEFALISSSGIQESKNPTSDASKYLNFNYLDVGKNKKMLKRYYIDESNVEKWNKKRVHRIRNEKIFYPPYVLMKTGTNTSFQCVSTYSEKKWVFKNAVRAIKGLKKDEKILKSIVGFLNSKFFTYFSFLTFSSIGVERQQLLINEITSLPLIIDDTLVRYVDYILKAHEDFDCEKIKVIQEKIDNLILKLLSFNAEEIDSFNYLFDVTIPMITDNPKAFRCVSDDDLIDYSNLFLNHFKFYFSENDNEYLHAIIHKSDSFIGVEFRIDDEKALNQIEFKDEENLLNLMGNLSIEDQNDLYINRDIKGFGENSFYVIKANEYKNWHRAIARLDISEFMDSLIN